MIKVIAIIIVLAVALALVPGRSNVVSGQSNACQDISSICNRPDIKRQCGSNTFIRRRCRKTCKLCGDSSTGVCKSCNCFTCLNGGTCSIKNRNPTCTCLSGFTGAHCQFKGPGTGTTPNKCKTIAGPSSNKNCIFPFVFNGTRYNRCAFDSDGFWCSTRVDSTGSHIAGAGNWGICGPNCPKVAVPSNRSNIVETVVSNQTLSVLALALRAANLVRTLNGAGPFTVFAPNNDAFANLLVNRLNQENTKKLKKVLMRHVVPKALKSGAIPVGSTILDTAGGEKITITKKITKKNGITIKSFKGTATVIKADILASNGVIHIVDNVF